MEPPKQPKENIVLEDILFDDISFPEVEYDPLFQEPLVITSTSVVRRIVVNPSRNRAFRELDEFLELTKEPLPWISIDIVDLEEKLVRFVKKQDQLSLKYLNAELKLDNAFLELPVRPPPEPLMEQLLEPPVEIIRHPLVEQIFDPPTDEIGEPFMEQLLDRHVDKLIEPIAEQLFPPPVDRICEPIIEQVFELPADQQSESQLEQLFELPADQLCQPLMANLFEPPADGLCVHLIQSLLQVQPETMTEPMTEPPAGRSIIFPFWPETTAMTTYGLKKSPGHPANDLSLR